MKNYVVTCGPLAVVLTDEQARELEYLARWRADLEYIKERYGAADPEAETSRKSIEFSFSRLDALRVPFWAQNAALAFGEDWRRQQSSGLFEWINARPGYTVSRAAN